jgi:acyl CoA:acetate/3-ketoacid CoA transferase beta subunit
MAGVQTDRFGNINLHRVGGTDESPAFRGPGVGNVSYAATSNRWYNYSSAHSRRAFVERVDFLTALGNEGGIEQRRARGPHYGDGCRFVISNLAVLDFEPQTGQMRLCHVHPGVTAEQVHESTGFTMLEAEEITETPAPTREELEVLRRVIDPTGVLR